MPHPDVFWYRLNDMGAKRNVFPCMFHVKSKWNIVYIYLKNKNFSRDSNILPQMHWTSDIFGHSATIIGGLGVSLNYPILNFKKTVCPNNVRMRHCRKNVFHKCFSSILCKNKKELLKARSSHQRCSIKKDVLSNFVKFTGKHLCHSCILYIWQLLLPKRLWKRASIISFRK